MTNLGPERKVCDQCGLKSSAAKKFCDHCGSAMAASAAAAAPAQPPPSPSKIERLSPPAMTRSASWTVMRRRDHLHNMAYVFILMLALAAAAYKYSVYIRPQNAVPRLAAEYLQALQNNNLEKAYGMLSSMAKANCSLDEFKTARSPSPWTWSNIKAVRVEPESVVVRYELLVEGRQPAEDFLHFSREEGGWARPYNWTLLQKAESALERNDGDMALLLSQAAVSVNPLDPMARGYLCEAVFYRRAYEDTARECAKAVELSRLYPSKLSSQSIAHLHAILADTYKDFFRRYPEAVEHYEAALSLPGLSAAEACRLLRARSAAKAASGNPANSLEDLAKESRFCGDPAAERINTGQRQR